MIFQMASRLEKYLRIRRTIPRTASAADAQAEERSGQDTENSGAGSEAQTEADGGNAEEIQNPGETVQTSAQAQSLAFASEVKLNREQVRSKNKETLMEIINNTSICGGTETGCH